MTDGPFRDPDTAGSLRGIVFIVATGLTLGVLYTDVWASMGQEAEAEERRKKFVGFQINAKVMSVAKPDATILHCLPAHYGEEIEYEASRTPNSAIFDEAENRMHAQNALLLLLLGP